MTNIVQFSQDQCFYFDNGQRLFVIPGFEGYDQQILIGDTMFYRTSEIEIDETLKFYVFSGKKEDIFVCPFAFDFPDYMEKMVKHMYKLQQDSDELESLHYNISMNM